VVLGSAVVLCASFVFLPRRLRSALPVVLLVLGIGGVLLAFLGGLLALGVLAIKIVLPIVLVVWLVRWMRRKQVGR
jgi:hypothetical protein